MNLWAVLLAAVSSFLLGGLWYSPPLFGRLWNAENGGPPQSGHPAKVFVGSKAPWHKITDTLPQHEEWPTGIAQ